MPFMLLFPGLLGFLGCLVGTSRGCTWILVWKGSSFPAMSIPEVFDPAPAPTALAVPSFNTQALIMHSRHILTTKPSVQGNQSVCPHPHSLCAQCVCTVLWCRVHPDPASCCTHGCLQPSHYTPCPLPELTVYLRGLPCPARGFRACLEWLSWLLQSCFTVCNSAQPAQRTVLQFSAILEHSKTKSCGDMQ